MENKDKKGWEKDLRKTLRKRDNKMFEFLQRQLFQGITDYFCGYPIEWDEDVTAFIRQVEQEAYERGYKIGLADGIE
jgi:hypothetical protein